MSFGLHFGELVALHRGEQGLSQAKLAIAAFEDESRKSRISELENGKIAKPSQAIVDALTVALDLSPDDISACRTKGRQKTGTLSFEQHEKNVRERLVGLEEKLRAATEGRDTLQRQAVEARRRLGDLESDYDRTQKELADARALLDRYDNRFDREKVDAAKRALDRGDKTLADALFAEIQASAQPTIEAAAEAAFERGRLAADDIRWHDADKHYGEAARLVPSYDHLIRAGEFAYKCGDYRRSAQYEEQLVRLAETEFGPEDPRTATALNNLAESYRAQGRFEKAEPLSRRALEIGEKTLGAEHTDVAIRLNNLAILLRETGRFGEAEPLYRRALEIGEKTLGTEHPEYAKWLNNIADLLSETGHLHEAAPLYRRALEISEKALGAEHPDVATWLNNLATLLRETGRFDEAEPLCLRALEITEKALGAEHPDVANRLNNLATLLADTNRADEAEPLYDRAVTIRRNALGDAHPHTKKGIANYEAFRATRDRRE